MELWKSIPYAIFAPWLSILIVAFGSILDSLEAAICVVMAIPLFLAFSSLGGYLVLAIYKNKNGRSSVQNTMLGIIRLAPYIVEPVEMKVPAFDLIQNCGKPNHYR